MLDPLRRQAPSYRLVITNLEPATLRFRVRFVVSQSGVAGAGDATQMLRMAVRRLNETTNLAGDAAPSPWTKSGKFYHCAADVAVQPGETARTGIEIALPLPSLTPSAFVFLPGDFLRGHWELTLPTVSVRVGAAPLPQLDRPARVLLAALRRTRGHAPEDSHELTAFPLASGRAEHVIAPDLAGAAAAKAKARGPSLKRAQRTARRRRAAKTG